MPGRDVGIPKKRLIPIFGKMADTTDTDTIGTSLVPGTCYKNGRYYRYRYYRYISVHAWRMLQIEAVVDGNLLHSGLVLLVSRPVGPQQPKQLAVDMPVEAAIL